jgi:hypothetical protein
MVSPAFSVRRLLSLCYPPRGLCLRPSASQDRPAPLRKHSVPARTGGQTGQRTASPPFRPLAYGLVAAVRPQSRRGSVGARALLLIEFLTHRWNPCEHNGRFSVQSDESSPPVGIPQFSRDAAALGSIQLMGDSWDRQFRGHHTKLLSLREGRGKPAWRFVARLGAGQLAT